MRKRLLFLAAFIVVFTGIAYMVTSPGNAAPSISILRSTQIPATAQIYFIGDSITGGAGAWNPSTGGYVARWTDRACGQDESCRSRIHVTSGAGGCLAFVCNGKPSVRDAWDTVILNANPKPTTVIVEIGVNDLFMPGVSAQTYAEAQQHIMYSAVSNDIRVLLATVPPTMTSWPWHAAHNPLRQSVNSWMRSYWGEGNLWDIDAGLRIGFSGDADPTYYTTGNPSPDGLHPSTLGHLCMADWLPLDRIV
jgi:lysophospholipase L1-like esterase